MMNRFYSQTTVPVRPGRICAVQGMRAAAFLLALTTSAMTGRANAGTITVDASKQTAGNPHFWSSTFGSGTASLILRSDLQSHFKIGNRELGAQRIRGHGLLNDDMGIFKAAGSYDFTKLDTYLSALSFAGMRPIMELDFMPSALGSNSANPTRSPPKDANTWKDFIKSIAQHCVDKFTAADVANWYWEVWNEPDYQPSPNQGFWTGTMNDYYTLYDNTVAALTSVVPNALVGGPATTNNGPVSAFLAHCKSAGTRVTFVSSHIYPGGGATGTSADPAAFVSDNTARINAITKNGYTTSAVKSFNTEWNSSYSGQGGGQGDAVTSMDNHWNVGFIVKSAKLLADNDSGDTPPLDVFSYWVLSDVFDESSGPSGSYMLGHTAQPFGQVFGLMTVQGMRKAAFNAFKLLNYTGPKRLSVSGGNDNSGGINAMATTSASGDSLQILLYNYNNTLSTASGSGDSQAISVSNLPSALAGKQVYVTTYVVDENHSNPYSVWKSGAAGCTSCSETQWQLMRAAQHLSATTKQQTVDTTFSTTVTMLKQSAMLIILSVNRPLMGRDAQVELEGEDYDGQSGATKEDSGDSATLGQSITFGSSGGNVFFDNVDFSDAGVGSVQLRVKSSADTTLELHQKTADGALLAKCTVTNTSGAWATQSCTLSQTATGFSTDPLYVVVAGALHLNYIKFVGSGGGTGGVGGTPGSGAGGTTVSGAGGSAGAGGTAGSGAGGAGASGGANTAGAGGASTGARGGATGPASGGSAGSAKGGSSGSGNGGASGNGNGGSDNGSGGSSGSPAGSGGNGNPGGSGGSASGGTTSPSGGASGCSCHVGGNGSRPSVGLLLIGVFGIMLAARGRIRRRN